MKKNLIITGCFGLMGMELIKLAASYDLSLVAGICSTQQIHGHAEFKVSSDLNEFVHLSDIIIDFSEPSAAVQFARICAASKKAFLSGTTGFTKEQYLELQALALETPIFVSPNMSIGIAKFSQILRNATQMLFKDYDIEILEMHHKQKADAPSGTAKMLGKIAAEAAGINYDKNSSLDRDHKRNKDEIGFASIRGGAIVGEHHIIFAGSTDIITLSHKALSRAQFAQGALTAAKWLIDQPKGKIYNMDDYLGHVETTSKY